jgi:hypothetical protein
MKNKRSGQIYFLIIVILISIIRTNSLYGQAAKRDSLDPRIRIDIKRLVSDNRHAANAWWYTWLSGYGAATVVQTGIAVTSPELKTRQDMWNGAATTFLGVVGLLATPLVPKDSEVNKLMSEGKDVGHIYTSSDFSEAMLKDIARREQFGRSWKVHAVTGVVNIGSGLVTWLGFKRSFGEGMVTFAINTVITEAQIWSQPIRAVRDYKKYVQVHSNGKLAGPALPSKQWIMSATPGGINIRLRF